MKKILCVILCLLSLTTRAQYKHSGEKDNTGLVISASGLVLTTISLFVKDGGEFTYSNGYNSTPIVKPFWQCTNRVVMLGISITIDVGGLIYYKTNK